MHSLKFIELLLKLANHYDIPLIKQASIYEKVWGPYTSDSGRKIVRVKDKDGEIKTISYPKYIMEEHLGRVLDPEEETVDHFDSNFENNDISNLRLVPRAEHSHDDTRRVKLIKLKCDICGKEFERSPRVIRFKSKHKKRGYFCSRACAGIYGRRIRLKLIKPLPIQTHYDSEYYKAKYQ
jgi:hypothetical protein